MAVSGRIERSGVDGAAEHGPILLPGPLGSSGTLRYLLGMDPLDTATIRKAIAIARDSGFRRIKLKSGDSTFEGTLSEEALSWGEEWESPETEPEAVVGPQFKAITAEHVGYLRELPDKLTVGSTVEPGDVIAEIVALGIANELVATCSGTISAVHCQNGEPVEYGQTILEIEQS